MMNLYDATLKAADYIERNPGDFIFSISRVPDRSGHCGSFGCALGWIGFFAGIRGTAGTVGNVLPHDFRMEGEVAFYVAMNAYVGTEWKLNAYRCAKGMRMYAEEHLAPYKRLRDSLQLESVPQAPPGNTIPSDAEEEEEVL